ncbi:LAFE_0F00232g1_1 [Lachancea fermentati]|uniref:LAFE_0F00232g1_1 n=1 Tax=Lachancea fermentati TaxID=4955 RepID=A0A1G4MEG4_LACFM|nr:LAFE_0F00232g1_1 [Lachancea fermentati]
MLAKSRNPCRNCVKQKTRCDRVRPVCKTCAEKRVSCKYDLALQWGGRPFKNMSKHLKLPKGCIMEDGVLTVEKKKKRAHKCKAELEKSAHVNYLSSEVESSPNTPFMSMIVKQKILLHSVECMFKLPPGRLPAMDFVLGSSQYKNLLDFFINRTSRVLVSVDDGNRELNPFRDTVLQMAIHSLTLMKIIIAFAAEHRHQLMARKVGIGSSSVEKNLRSNSKDKVSQQLLNEAIQGLVTKLERRDEKYSEQTLASVLMLAAYGIFFGDRRAKWSSHLTGARIILRKMLGPSRSGTIVVRYTGAQEPQYFLYRWFTYISVMGLLSCATSAYSEEIAVDFSSFNRSRSSLARIGEFDSIEYNLGMEAEVLEMLNKVGSIVMKSEKQGSKLPFGKLVADAVELDYKITRYLDRREMEQNIFSDRASSSDQFLRATNILFCLSGILHLRRRVMGMPPNSSLVREVVLQAASILEKKIPANSTTLCSITSCLFTCGCECVEPDLVHLQPLFLSRLEQVIELGMSSTLQAKNIMEECWRTGNDWWIICKQWGTDLSFGL